MTAATIARTRHRIALRRRANLATAIAVVGLLVMSVAYAFTGGGSDEAARTAVSTFKAADGSFAISYPKGWRAQAAGRAGAGAEALISRPDGRSMVLIRERARVSGSLEKLARDLGPQLKRRFKDFKPVSARIVHLSTGPALSYTFVRERSGVVQGIVVVPAGSRSFTLETVTRGDAPDVAKQLGGIVRSFRT